MCCMRFNPLSSVNDAVTELALMSHWEQIVILSVLIVNPLSVALDPVLSLVRGRDYGNSIAIQSAQCLVNHCIVNASQTARFISGGCVAVESHC